MPSILQYGTIPILGFIYFIAVILIYRREVSKYSKAVFTLFKYGLVIKLFCSLGVELLYMHYYGYGDTLVYYREATSFVIKLLNNPLEVYHLFTLSPADYKVVFADAIVENNSLFDYYNESTVRMIKVTAFLSLFSFNSIFGTGMLYGCLCYIGLWYIYKTVAYHMPDVNQKALFLSIVFMPSVMFWGSGILKEPLAIFLLGLIIYNVHKLIIKRKLSLSAILILMVVIPFLNATKSYYLLVFYPSFISFVILHYVGKVNSMLLRRMIKGSLIITLIGLIFLIPTILIKTGLNDEIMASTLEHIIRYSENLSKSAGSVYELNLEGTDILSLIKVAPQAIIVSLFRPFLWESTKVVILVSAIESTFVLLFSIYFFFKVRMVSLIRLMFDRPILVFLLLFTLLFAIITGVSSGNFGALARYKIPLVPLYLSFLTSALSLLSNQEKKLNNVL